MKWTSLNDLRASFLSFFESKGHLCRGSYPLVPENDKSLLLIVAGMAPLKKYFTGELTPPCRRMATCQKCIRTNDIENVGYTARHGTFFEMLGNFSFGDYFKQEALPWAWEYLTKVLEIPEDRLWPSVYEEDDEAYSIWRDKIGVREDHIVRLGKEDNFWEHGSGPCGPCSEIYFDRGEKYGCGKPDCKPGCDCDRYLEFWNCVFTQFDGQEDGTLAPLLTKNIDTGMGLERIAAIMQGVTNNYDTDVLRSLVGVGERLSGKTYKQDAAVDKSLRIIADHSRSVTFMIADGILPSNEGRGYVLRRLLRRAIQKAHMIGIEGPFLNDYVDEIVELMGSVYPEVVENRELIRRVILSEEERFGATLRQGQVFLAEALDKLEGDTLSGEEAFTLHDTYGFPVEVTEEMCADRNVKVDMEGFERCMDEQRERARAANTKDAEAAWSTYGGIHADVLKEVGATEFVGYSELECAAKVVAIIANGDRVEKLSAGEEGEIVLDTTTFYAEMGGEVGDTGTLRSADAEADVLDTKAPEKGLVCHKTKVASGTIAVGDEVTAVVDGARRARITRNHTATHILHAALRRVLGDHVKQAGSYVGPDRLRFDFTHFEATTPEQLAEVERVANEEIMSAVSTNIYETSLDAARESGVTALFGEKYGDVVRVVECGEFSRELCGGCHVANTAEIGLVKITSETGVGANLRRIEAVTSFGALEYVNKVEAELKETAAELRVPMFDVSERTAANMKALKEFQKTRKAAKTAISDDGVNMLLSAAKQAQGGYPVIISRVKIAQPGAMRNMWDVVRARMETPGAVVLIADNEGKATLLAAGTDEAVAAGFNAGAVIKEIAPCVKGGGGGKPTMAQAGGKDVSGIDAALESARKMLL